MVAEQLVCEPLGSSQGATRKTTEKATSCAGGCGKLVQYRTTAKVFCEPCRKARKLEKDRKAATVQRRKNGVEPVKGTLAICKRCGGIYERRSINNRYCIPCREPHKLEIARAASKRKSATDQGREYAREWHRRRRATDAGMRVSAHFKSLIHRALKGKKAGRSWREFVPYTLEDLMQHLERQFLPGMSWHNKGEWHIDHIIPRASFKFSSPDDPEFQACWALTNLRPLWAKENISKNARRTLLL